MVAIPRLLIAGTHSGVGKTTVATGVMRAFAQRGWRVQPFKVGPDFIDPGHHNRAAGRTSHNLDGWMLGRDAVLEIFERAATGADLSVIEGVMGLHDGITGESEAGSTAEMAKLLKTPVILVVDASALARSLAALLKGYQEFDREVDLVGVIANRVSGPGHFQYLSEAVEKHTTLRLLGYLPPSREIEMGERHLGLHTALEVHNGLYERIAERIEATVDLDAVADLARRAGPLEAYRSLLFTRGVSPHQKELTIAYAWDPAFCFYYQTNFELLRTRGCHLVHFSPLNETRLPSGVDLLYLGGGYPELYAEALSENRGMLDSIRGFAESGGSIYAECGGLMYLSEGIVGRQDRCFPMVGLLPGRVALSDRPTLRYVEISLNGDALVGPSGMQLRGHEFHYSRWVSPPDLSTVYRVRDARGADQPPDGIQCDRLLAAYAHLHLASHPQAATCLVDRLHAYQVG